MTLISPYSRDSHFSIIEIKSPPPLRPLIAISVGYLFLLGGIALGINSLLSKPEWNANMTISASLSGTGGLLTILGILGLRKTEKKDEKFECSETEGTYLSRNFTVFPKGV